jgi:hypothetical protein
MIDDEVMRLRRLRNTALRAREMAAMLDSNAADRSSALSQSAVSCWGIARAVTGRLREHPYLSYQREPSSVRCVYHGIRAAMLAAIARYRGRTFRTFFAELQRLARELDDARALTWSIELSDTFGRSQARIRTLIKELEAAALVEVSADARNADARNAYARIASARNADARDADAGNEGRVGWPYLAFQPPQLGGAAANDTPALS